MGKNPCQKSSEIMMWMFLQNLRATKNISLSESRNLDIYVQTWKYMILLFLYLWAINQTWQF